MLVLVVLVLLGEVPNPFEAKVPPLEKEMCQTTETDKTKRNIFRGGCLRGLQDKGKEQRGTTTLHLLGSGSGLDCIND